MYTLSPFNIDLEKDVFVSQFIIHFFDTRCRVWLRIVFEPYGGVMHCVLKEKINVNKTIHNSSMDLALEKFLLEDFPLIVGKLIESKYI